MNWHDRSLAPERLWGQAYRELLEEIDAADDACYATAANAVAWFRWRRSIRFERQGDDTVVVAAGSLPHGCPQGTVAVHRGDGAGSEQHDLGSGSTLRFAL